MSERCCGTCRHAVWRSERDGECHGAWWEYPDQRRYPLYQQGKWIKVRPFLLSKGQGSKCQTWKGQECSDTIIVP